MIGVIAGIIVLNVLLLISWSIVKIRRLKAKRALSPEENDHHRVSTISISRPTGAFVTSRHFSVQSEVPQTQLTHIAHGSLTSKPSAPSLKESMRPGSSSAPRTHAVGSSFESRTQSLRSKPSAAGYESDIFTQLPTRPPRAARPPSSRLSSIQPEGSIRRRNSLDAVSVYSSGSVPLENSDSVFRPFSLDPGPSSAPSLSGDLEGVLERETGYVWPSRNGQSSSPSLKARELPPEASGSSKIHWKTHLSSRTASVPHFPPIPETVITIPPVPSLPEHIRSPVRQHPSVDPLGHHHNPSSNSATRYSTDRSGSGSSSSSNPNITGTRIDPTTTSISSRTSQRQRVPSQSSLSLRQEDSESIVYLRQELASKFTPPPISHRGQKSDSALISQTDAFAPSPLRDDYI
jgi:hypothetical protein